MIHNLLRAATKKIKKRGAHAPRWVQTTKRGESVKAEFAGSGANAARNARVTVLRFRRKGCLDGWPEGATVFLAPGIVTRMGGDACKAAPGRSPRARSRG